jgi:hypothetical protein
MSGSTVFYNVNRKMIDLAYGSSDNCSDWIIMFANLWVISNQEQKEILLSSAFKALQSERLN